MQLLLLIFAVAAALLPFPQKYTEGRGFCTFDKNRISVNIVDSIPEAGTHQGEAYRINITRKGVSIEAVTPIGELRARQTMDQLLVVRHGRNVLPCCRITDWAAFPIRGIHLDIGRAYLPVPELKKQLAALASLKINVFHWHLTDNQAWRLESKAYPQLCSPEHQERFKGQYYSWSDVREVVDFCSGLGISVIPEIDMPGHSKAFTRAMGFEMQSEEGIKALKIIVREAVELFRESAYFHIGCDEVKIWNEDFVPQMVDYVRSLGMKVMAWNPGFGFEKCGVDMEQWWMGPDTDVKEGTPTIVSSNIYLNHFDSFTDIRRIYSSKLLGRDESDSTVYGAIAANWNDRKINDPNSWIRQNNLVFNMMAVAERTWRGGAPGDFDDFEARALELKGTRFGGYDIPYVSQKGCRWAITQTFDNGGDPSRVFPPESGKPEDWFALEIEGSGAMLRHFSKNVPVLFDIYRPNSTVYAYTYVHSPKRQEVGLWAETQNYSRSSPDMLPPEGCWDYKGSEIFLNGKKVPAPKWVGTEDRNDIWGNMNMFERKPEKVTLEKGWNLILIKLPVPDMDIRPKKKRHQKWMFSCTLVDPATMQPLRNIVYDPTALHTRE